MAYNNGAAPVRNYVKLNLAPSYSTPVSQEPRQNDNDLIKAKLEERDGRIQDLLKKVTSLEDDKQEVIKKNKEIYQQKLELERTIESLRRETKSSNTRDNSEVKTLENRLQEVEEDRQTLLERIAALEQEKNSLAAENGELKQKVQDLEQQLKQQAAAAIVSSPLPPAAAPPLPPPPPPPPPILASTQQPFLQIRKSASCSDVSAKKEDKPRDKTYEQAMEEMMLRIKAGKPLRSTPTKQLSTPNDEEDIESDCELKQITNTLTVRHHSVGRLGDDLQLSGRPLRFGTPQNLPKQEQVQPLNSCPLATLTPSKENIDPSTNWGKNLVTLLDPPKVQRAPVVREVSPKFHQVPKMVQEFPVKVQEVPKMSHEIPMSSYTPSIIVSPAPRKTVVRLKTVEPKVLVWDEPGPSSTSTGPVGSGNLRALTGLPPSGSAFSSAVREAKRDDQFESGMKKSAQLKEGSKERKKVGESEEARSELHRVFRQRGLSMRRDDK